MATKQASFWFDPVCPWTWITSRWMLEVQEVRDVNVHWRVMSLSHLNEGKSQGPKIDAILEKAWGLVRVITATRAHHGPDIVLPLYTAMGTRIHLGQEEDYSAVIAASLHEVGLPAELADAADDDSYNRELFASHDAAMSLVGMEVGAPVISVDDVAFFGPVVTPAPKGEAAGRLWDGVLAVAETDGFFELKRSRDREPDFS